MNYKKYFEFLLNLLGLFVLASYIIAVSILIFHWMAPAEWAWMDGTRLANVGFGVYFVTGLGSIILVGFFMN